MVTHMDKLTPYAGHMGDGAAPSAGTVVHPDDLAEAVSYLTRGRFIPAEVYKVYCAIAEKNGRHPTGSNWLGRAIRKVPGVTAGRSNGKRYWQYDGHAASSTAVPVAPSPTGTDRH
jgi:hypothetical protein